MKKYLSNFILIILCIFLQNTTQAACGPGQSEIIVKIIPDNWPNETSWNIKNSSGTIIASGTYNTDTICVAANSCLIFSIYDTYGDGIYAPGGYWVYLDGTLISSGNSFGSGTSFAVGCPQGSYCTSPLPISIGQHTTGFEDSWYVYNCSLTGLYEISTCSTNTCNTAIWMYSSCIGNYTEDATGTYAFNDDFCGQQSRIITTLIAGHTYYIRIGDIMDSCTDSIHFEFSYSGPITGCTDPASCNFNPLASVDDGSCIYFPDPGCQGPDLELDSMSLINSLTLQTIVAQNCDVQEGCLLNYGTRKVLSFTSKIFNYGTLDYYIGNPTTQPGMFNTSNCHGHAHYEGYGDYRLYDSNNNVIPAGHKNGFCVMDLCGFGQYNCGNMGISTNCYDVYGLGTQCQWIDITDVPTGDYRLAVIINAAHAPDAFGHHEINYVNNAVQICLHIEQDSINGPSFTMLPSCAPFVDCNGIPGGDAIVDCNGVCGGGAHGGDRQNDGVLNNDDISIYLDDIENSISSSASCVDVSGNGFISIYDAALVKWCSKNTYILYPGGSPNYTCNFPRNITNPNELTGLEIANVNLAGGFLDVVIHNPSSDISAFQFSVSGVTIQNVVSLANSSFPVDLRFNATTNSIFGISLQDSVLTRSSNPQPLVRVYFSGVTAGWICISEIVDVVNSNAERTTASILGSCFPATPTATVDQHDLLYFHLVPNPTNDVVNLTIQNVSGKALTASVYDYSGRLVEEFYIAPNKNNISFTTEEWRSGIYFVKVSNDSFYRIEKLIKQ
ncbi:MAG: T9SS type A sorting domain-containing protein [Bacteroidia bacterium]|nr:T9SS type A sorting domain-containing protein [Bacteroidia bacterium]